MRKCHTVGVYFKESDVAQVCSVFMYVLLSAFVTEDRPLHERHRRGLNSRRE